MAQALNLPDFQEIFIHRESLRHEVSERVRSLYPADRIVVVEDDPFKDRKGSLTKKEFELSKKRLYLTPFQGEFFKRCPGSTQKKVLACCNYHVLNLGQQCNFNCSYCYLQSYLNTPVTKIYTNIDEALNELNAIAESRSELPFRVGTGEVIDSLSLDPLTLYSRKLIEFFRRYPSWILEFKTKSAAVDQFLDCTHAGNVVVSWSINPAVVIDKEEHGTASLDDRLDAARKCRDKGFPVAFHIDPMIWFPEWKDAYHDLVRRITELFTPQDINVVSIGALRFQPSQRHLMRERFGMDSWVTRAEMFPSEGGKMRYDARLRQEMFQHVLGTFKKVDEGYRIFFCMETPESWISAYDALPMKRPELQPLFRPLPEV